jgi:F-type H+-transporting ATPase subunit b
VRFVEFFVGAQAWASSASAEHHGPSIHEIWFPLINFLIFVYLIVRYGVPKVQSFLESRRDEAVASMAELSAKQRQAEALVQDYRQRLAALDKEAAELQAQLRDDGEREKIKLLSEAQALAAKIKEDADFLADQEIRRARQKLREEMVALAEAAARELVRRNLSAADQTRLVEGFIQSIGQSR